MEEMEVVMEGAARDIKALAAFHAQVDSAVATYKEEVIAKAKGEPAGSLSEPNLSLQVGQAAKNLLRDYPK